MPKRMLIDASHPEETRVIVLDGQKVEEFDFEAASKRPLKGNIYLAKVTRVEPSLQAAFVEYGGNRQGFLAFSEIHPDYYQIPVADRIALLAEQEAEARRRTDDEFESFETARAPAQEAAVSQAAQTEFSGNAVEEHASDETPSEPHDFAEPVAVDREPDEFQPPTIPEATIPEDTMAIEAAATPAQNLEDAAEELFAENGESRATVQRAQPAQRPLQRWVRRKHYKIQEVIKRRQVILVQVVKEERGNKGAALTTYLSLPGRYCVLMPNTPRGGGISRKITNVTDRKRLKSAAQALELPEGMGLIIRTAGANRTKAEIKRDYEYLLRMWDTIRDITLKSNAPACVYEEGDLIKRAIRDLYNKDVSEIVVEGEDGYRNAKDFMRMLMPSHAKNVKLYKEPVPLFQRLHIEAQLDGMFSPTVTLRSGGYVVINQTEALVAIDVNSGRATREHSIEDTAYKTNMEAAEEIARQLRLRDLAGLIVIDFIDMEDARNDRNVEKRLRDCIKNDRARVQIGKISQFGLLEMSRQRLRAGVVAGSTIPCPACNGQGIVRSVESTALRVLRALDEEGQRQRASALHIYAPLDVVMYTLNQKRREIARMEQDHAVTISFQARAEMQAGTFELERMGQRMPELRSQPEAQQQQPVEVPEPREPETAVEDVVSEDVSPPVSSPEIASSGDGGGRRRRRRRRRGRGYQEMSASQQALPALEHGREDEAEASEEDADEHVTASPEEHGESTFASPASEGGGRRRRRRRRRGRRGPREGGFPMPGEAGFADENGRRADQHIVSRNDEVPETAANAPSAPVWSLFPDETDRAAPAIDDGEKIEKPHFDETRERTTFAEPKPMERHAETATVVEAPVETPERLVENTPASHEPPAPARKGWWQRPFKLRD